ncbi:hypothetical protein Back2_23450 [Nocardioides baekrokdamisoli]|uniref:Uncharacterized protein n=1 Tax=Nocardioides baekrokdamisoli TaxID=1804624 RepID=A0A3G9J365_9ACTN|nr:hypothetical protein [Nocardioides baekrokdamisoli]BBH18058.1 hypothetical protein Back2_23450 [Nocardioides baekrokdamisoli]
MIRPLIPLAAFVSSLTAIAATSLPAAPAHADAFTPPRVGWWGGQAVSLCGAADPTSCPRDTSAYTPAVWDAMVAGHGFLDYDVEYHSDFGPAMAGVNQRTDAIPVVREANARNVPINAWITVPLAYGTFANENNAVEIQHAVQDFAAWAQDNSLHFGQAILDLEFPAGYQPIYQAAMAAGNPAGLQSLLQGNFDPSHQCAAAATYAATIMWAHQHGLTLSGTPILFALDDLEHNGSVALQDGLDMAPMPPSGYDTLYLQAYRAFTVDLGSGLVAAYYREMQSHFGAKGQVSLGNTGMNPYTTTGPLVADIRMLAAMGASEIPIFDFDSTIKNWGAAGIAQILDAANHPMSPVELATAEQMSPTGTAARAMFATLDDVATAATPLATLATGHPQRPNAYPGGCTSGR